MKKIPEFLLYGDNNPQIKEEIQPRLELRGWNDLEGPDKAIVLKQLVNQGWLKNTSYRVLETAEHLNHHFLRQCPCRNLHNIEPRTDRYGNSNERDRMQTALDDLKQIILYQSSEPMVLRMLSKLAETCINKQYYQLSEKEDDEKRRNALIAMAFRDFDQLAGCLNHIFDQFSINILLTRNGFIPRQDKIIMENIYVPTIKILAQPMWKTVNTNLANMFKNYQEGDYSEAITKAHSVVQGFLQILVTGKEGKSGKGEMEKGSDPFWGQSQ